MQAAEAMVGAGIRGGRRERSAPDKKVKPQDLMVRAPSLEADATWMALVSRLRRRVDESLVTCPSNSSSKLPKKDSFIANIIGVRRTMGVGLPLGCLPLSHKDRDLSRCTAPAAG